MIFFYSIHDIYSCGSLDDIPCKIDNHSGCMKAESRGGRDCIHLCRLDSPALPHLPSHPPPSLELCRPLASLLACLRAQALPSCFPQSTTLFFHLKPLCTTQFAKSIHQFNLGPTTKLFLRQDTRYDDEIMTQHLRPPWPLYFGW